VTFFFFVVVGWQHGVLLKSCMIYNKSFCWYFTSCYFVSDDRCDQRQRLPADARADHPIRS
jgi:hypothetical protein